MILSVSGGNAHLKKKIVDGGEILTKPLSGEEHLLSRSWAGQ